MAASVLTVHVMLHMAIAAAAAGANATVDRTLQFFPKICQLIHNPPPPCPSRTQRKSVHFWLRRCDFDLKQYLDRWSERGAPAATIRFSFAYLLGMDLEEARHFLPTSVHERGFFSGIRAGNWNKGRINDGGVESG